MLIVNTYLQSLSFHFLWMILIINFFKKIQRLRYFLRLQGISPYNHIQRFKIITQTKYIFPARKCKINKTDHVKGGKSPWQNVSWRHGQNNAKQQALVHEMKQLLLYKMPRMDQNRTRQRPFWILHQAHVQIQSLMTLSWI